MTEWYELESTDPDVNLVYRALEDEKCTSKDLWCKNCEDDAKRVVAALRDAGRLTDSHYSWHNAGLEVAYRWDCFQSANNPVDQADQLVELSNAISDLKSWLPEFDIETGTMPWDREEEV